MPQYLAIVPLWDPRLGRYCIVTTRAGRAITMRISANKMIHSSAGAWKREILCWRKKFSFILFTWPQCSWGLRCEYRVAGKFVARRDFHCVPGPTLSDCLLQETSFPWAMTTIEMVQWNRLYSTVQYRTYTNSWLPDVTANCSDDSFVISYRCVLPKQFQAPWTCMWGKGTIHSWGFPSCFPKMFLCRCCSGTKQEI